MGCYIVQAILIINLVNRIISKVTKTLSGPQHRMVLYFIFMVFLVKNSNSNCLMKGEFNDESNVYYNGTAVNLDVNGSYIFANHCFFMLPKDWHPADPISTCCATDQLKRFDSMISMLENLSPDCGTCTENLKRLTCTIICSPNQSDFSYIRTNATTPNQVISMDYFLNLEFAEKFYKSCEGIKFPNSIIPLLSLLCGEGLSACNPKKLIESLMSQSTFPLTAHVVTETDVKPVNIKPINPPVLGCNETLKKFGSEVKKCSCQDCASSCPPAPPVPTDENKLFWNYFTVYQFLVLIAYIVTVLTFIIAWIVLSRKNSGVYNVIPGEGDVVDENDINSVENDDDDPILDYGSTTAYLQIKIYNWISNKFSRWGSFVAQNKSYVSAVATIVIIVCSCGVLFHFEVTSNPLDIWSPKNSQFRQQKDFFDKNFGPFYRTEQILIKAPQESPDVFSVPGINITMGKPLKKDILEAIFDLQEKIIGLQYSYLSSDGKLKNVTLQHICFKPLEPYNSNCVVYSITQYFQNNIKNFNRKKKIFDWRTHLYYCANNYGSITDKDLFNIPCLSSFSAPVDPSLVYGGYNRMPMEADVLIITYVVNNYLSDEENKAAKVWESGLLQFLANYSHPSIEITFSAETSIQNEIDRQSKNQMSTILISYMVMFLYVSLSLGKFQRFNVKEHLVHQKIVLGLSGVLIVLLSVMASVGFFCYMKYQINMIILEVLPFLVLAIGVDNIFLMTHEYRRIVNHSEYDTPTFKLVGTMLGKIGHGIFVSSVAQVVTFSIGCISNIPAVKSFSLFAAVAIFFNFLLQISLFLVIFTLDAKRTKDNRSDIFCCFHFVGIPNLNSGLSFLEKTFKALSRIVFNRHAKPAFLLAFITIWFASLYSIPSLELGLDQNIALPMDSYLNKYFYDIFHFLKTGPPIYFVVYPGFKYENIESRRLICSGPTCAVKSLSNIVNDYSRISNYSHIATPLNSWVDTYMAWLAPSSSYKCCQYYKANPNEFCPSYKSPNFSDCSPCTLTNNDPMKVSKSEFAKYLPWFLSDIPVKACPFGGKPTFGRSVVLNTDYYQNNNTEATVVYSSSFMGYHTAMASEKQLIDAVRKVTNISNVITNNIHHHTIPYSMFYIFYESYLTIWKEALTSFSISFVVLFAINIMMYGFEIRMSIIMTFLIFLMDLTNMGIMYLLGIRFNPVSMVNLIMFLGINVEFVSHMGRAYLSSAYKTRNQKAISAFIFTGSSVFSGIAMTKIFGIMVLAFSTSLLFRIYYFQMYIFAIIVGTLHGLIALPILLSYVGPLPKSPTALFSE